MRTTTLLALAVASGFGSASRHAAAQDAASQEPAAPAAERVELRRLDRGVYHLLAAKAERPPKDGYGLVVVLPGGDGGWEDDEAFLPFVTNGIHRNAVPDDHVTALGVAVRWTDEQEIVWPTADADVKGARWTTERYIAAVVDDVAKRTEIDRDRVTLLGWSSSGPAIWATVLQRRRPAERAYVAMSVFKPEARSERHAKDLRVVLDQSPEDRVTPFRFAERAHEVLGEHGAAVWLRTYAGGHGWHDAPLPRIAAGLAWLDGDAAAPETTATEPAAGANRIDDGGFEDGLGRWRTIGNSGRMTVDFDDAAKGEGKQSLHLTKTGGMPLDLVRRDVDLAGAQKVTVSAWVAAEAAGNAFLKFFAYDASGATVSTDVDIVQLRGDREGGRVEKTWQLDGKAETGAVMLVMVMDGEVWLDDVQVKVDTRD